jgi:STE24 endopeptidase
VTYWLHKAKGSVPLLFALFLVPALAQSTFDPVAAVQQYLGTVTPEEQARSNAYFDGRRWLLLWDFLMVSAACVLLLEARVGARVRDRLSSLRWPILRDALIAAVILLLLMLLTAPFACYATWIRERQYDLANLTFGGWLYEYVLGWALETAALAPLAALGYWIVRRAPRTWHWWVTAIGAGYLVVSGIVAPVFVAPFFNRYEPLPDSPLKQEILALARANGMPVNEVYQYDASRQSDKITASVTGVFGTARIVLGDTLLDGISPQSVKAVVGHELGHYVLNHLARNILFNTVLLALGLLFARWTLGRLLAWRGSRWRVKNISDAAGVAAVVLVLYAWSFATTPLTNTLLRSVEREADYFGLNAAQEPDGFAEVMVLLGEGLHRVPGPVEEFLFFDHPPSRSRIEAAMRWKAEHLRPGVSAAQ